MKKFLTLSIAFLAVYPNLGFSAETHEHDEKTKQECSDTKYAALKKFIAKNKRALIYSSVGSALITKTVHKLLLKDRRFAALGTTLTGLAVFSSVYYIYQGCLNLQLKRAIHSGDCELTKQVIANGADVNALFTNDKGGLIHPLVEASLINYKMIQLLLDNGANEDLIDNSTTKQFYLNNKQECLNSELVYAIQEKNTQQVEYCISKEACLLEFKVGGNWHSALLSAKQSNLEIMKLILEKIDPKNLDLASQDHKHYHQLMQFYMREDGKQKTEQASSKTPETTEEPAKIKQEITIETFATAERTKENEESPKEQLV